MQIPIGAEAVGVGADDLEELEEDDDDYIRLGHEDEHEADFSKLQLKPDHQNRQEVGLSAAAAALTSNCSLHGHQACQTSFSLHFQCSGLFPLPNSTFAAVLAAITLQLTCMCPLFM